MKTRKRVGSVLICIGMLLIISAALLAAYNIYDDSRAAAEAENVLTQIKAYIKEQPKDTGKDNDMTQEGSDTDIAPEDDKSHGEETEMAFVEVDGYRYIGMVSIPAISIELPIMEQWDYVRMKISPCRYSGSVNTDDLIICAHNYRSHFGNIGNLRTGDEVIITDVAGNVFRYQVAYIDTVSGTAVGEMTSGDWDLTLFTCTYNGRSRVTVRCMRADT